MSIKTKLGCGVLLAMALALRFTVFSVCFEQSGICGNTLHWLWYEYFSVIDHNPADKLYRFGKTYSFNAPSEFDPRVLYRVNETFKMAAETDEASFTAVLAWIDGGFLPHAKSGVSAELQTAYDNLTGGYGELKDLHDNYSAAMQEYLEFLKENIGVLAYDYEAAMGKLKKEEYSDKLYGNLIDIEKANQAKAIEARAVLEELKNKAISAWTLYDQNRDAITDRIGFYFGKYAEELSKI